MFLPLAPATCCISSNKKRMKERAGSRRAPEGRSRTRPVDEEGDDGPPARRPAGTTYPPPSALEVLFLASDVVLVLVLRPS